MSVFHRCSSILNTLTREHSFQAKPFHTSITFQVSLHFDVLGIFVSLRLCPLVWLEPVSCKKTPGVFFIWYVIRTPNTILQNLPRRFYTCSHREYEGVCKFERSRSRKALSFRCPKLSTLDTRQTCSGLETTLVRKHFFSKVVVSNTIAK